MVILLRCSGSRGQVARRDRRVIISSAGPVRPQPPRRRGLDDGAPDLRAAAPSPPRASLGLAMEPLVQLFDAASQLGGVVVDDPRAHVQCPDQGGVDPRGAPVRRRELLEQLRVQRGAVGLHTECLPTTSEETAAGVRLATPKSTTPTATAYPFAGPAPAARLYTTMADTIPSDHCSGGVMKEPGMEASDVELADYYDEHRDPAAWGPAQPVSP